MNCVAAQDIIELFMLAVPVAAFTWTFTHEELFKELHEYFLMRSEHAESLAARKFFYLLTCEYCFSHYVSAAVLVATGFTLVFTDWRGYLIAWLSLVWVANHLISMYGRLRLGIRSERLDINLKEAVTKTAGISPPDQSRRRKAS
jgi:hypothetical protein